MAWLDLVRLHYHHHNSIMNNGNEEDMCGGSLMKRMKKNATGYGGMDIILFRSIVNISDS